MSDLIRREDAIKAVVNCRRWHFFEIIEVTSALINVPSADRPSAEWIFHYRDKWMVKAECPKCHRRFEFSPRTIWKCCPVCETRMKGASNEADSDKSK